MGNKANITIKTNFIEQQSDSKNSRYVFAYTITIKNTSDSIFQLVSRHWVIKDANQKIEEIYGDGVIGEQPFIKPGAEYTYSSGAILETDMGTMEGRYFMKNDQENEFVVPIPEFLLSIPRVLH